MDAHMFFRFTAYLLKYYHVVKSIGVSRQTASAHSLFLARCIDNVLCSGLLALTRSGTCDAVR